MSTDTQNEPSASSKGQLHDTFVQRLNDLQGKADQIAQAARGSGGRPWQVPDELVSLFPISQLHEPAYDREAANSNYEQLIQSFAGAGVAGDLIAVKQQIDYVAAEERAFRARHASGIRCLAQAAGRRKGHGDVQGIFTGGVQRMVSNYLQAGAS